jgi:tetratricopeptide (TPR) repeat protein
MTGLNEIAGSRPRSSGPVDTANAFRLADQALTQLRQGDVSGACASVSALWSLRPDDVRVLTAIGQVAAAIERHDVARAAFERAVAHSPDDPRLLFNLATSLRNFGEFERAERLYDQVIAKSPNDFEAFRNRSELRRQTPERNHIAELEAALARSAADWRGAVMLRYALGKEREDLGDHDGAFADFDAGARLRRRNTRYDVEADLLRMRRIGSVFGADWAKGRPTGCPSAEPIFVFGLPRSGSTLLERMLGAHSRVFAAGELQTFGITAMRLAGEAAAPPDADLIERTARIDPRRLGETYVQGTRPHTGATAHFIDKLPNNFLYAGLIAAALPNAVMIHIRRDARDAGYAMYKTLFKQAYPFSYDLGELGRYIRAYQDLMAHWRTVFPGRIVEVAYERLVEAPEAALGEVLDRCGLALEPACLSFFENAQASSTASSVQVRRPIYNSSVGAWRRCERQLAPLIESLGADGFDAIITR